MSFAVYEFYDNQRVPIYIGVTMNFGLRHRSHQSASPWYGEVAGYTLREFPTATEAAEAEVRLIAERQPRYNRERIGWSSTNWLRTVSHHPSHTPRSAPVQSRVPPPSKSCESLRTIRARRLLTARDVAKLASVAISTILLVETGEIVPRFATIRKIADALGMPPAEITEFAAAIEQVAHPPRTTPPKEES